MNTTHITISPTTHNIHNNTASINVHIPGSKSHTIRGLLLSALAEGTSTIYNPLISGDTKSCLNFLHALDITTTYNNAHYSATGFVPSSFTVTSQGLQHFTNSNITKPIDIGNSGTTLYFATALAALSKNPIPFDGDASLRTRSASPLLQALNTLGAHIQDNNHGCVPYSISGPIQHGTVTIQCSTSQYLSALLVLCALISGKSTIHATLEGEFPYIDMTLHWLKKQGITIIPQQQYQLFEVQGGHSIIPFTENIPGDFSSAAFFLSAAAIMGSPIVLQGLAHDPNQADMAMLDILEQMGCTYTWNTQDNHTVLHITRTTELTGGTFDLANTPDLLPILSVVAAYANSPTRIYNVAHARKKRNG